MSPATRLGLAVCAYALMVLVVWGIAAAMAQSSPGPSSPPSPPSCETRLTVWRENAANFIQQIMEMDAQNRDLRARIEVLTKERDEAQARANGAVIPPTQEEKR